MTTPLVEHHEAPTSRRRNNPAAYFLRAMHDYAHREPSPVDLGIPTHLKLGDHLRQIAQRLEREPQLRMLATPDEPFHAVMTAVLDMHKLLEEMTPEHDAHGKRLVELLKRFATALQLNPQEPVTIVYTSAAPKDEGLHFTPEEWQDLLLLLDRVVP